MPISLASWGDFLIRWSSLIFCDADGSPSMRAYAASEDGRTSWGWVPPPESVCQAKAAEPPSTTATASAEPPTMNFVLDLDLDADVGAGVDWGAISVMTDFLVSSWKLQNSDQSAASIENTIVVDSKRFPFQSPHVIRTSPGRPPGRYTRGEILLKSATLTLVIRVTS